MQASPYPMVSIEEAIQTILDRTPSLAAEEVALEQAHGRVLAEHAVANDDMPPFAASAVDGYAIIATDGTLPRQVISEITAGYDESVRVETGTTRRIMTGAPIPEGADTVVMVEDTREVDGVMEVLGHFQSGDNVHPQGMDLARGQGVLSPGIVLGAAEIGLLATVGRTRVKVYRRPVVAVLATGDELVEPDQPLRPGAIRDSNRYALLAAVREAGGIPKSLGMVRDDEAEQEALIRAGLREADVVLTSGGVSVGSRDLIKPILKRLGTVHFGRVSFKPGKPTTFATIEDRLVFGLPGFPVSSLVSFEVFVRPALRHMQGHLRIHRPVIQVEAGHEIHRSPDRPEYQRAVVRWHGGRLIAQTTGAQRSSRLLSLAGVNALLRVTPGSDPIRKGDQVPAVIVGELVAEE